MAERLRCAIQNGVTPQKTLCVTFTNRAAAEMRSRLQTHIQRRAKEVRVSTYHSLCARILRKDGDAIGLARDFVIYDETDCIELLGSIQSGMKSARDGRSAPELLAALGDAKSNIATSALTMGDVPRIAELVLDPGLAQIVDRYHQVLADRHALDFADLVLRTRTLFHLVPDKAEWWARRFEWIQVDEIQDTHLAEYDILQRLGRYAASIALFGDLDQTIYEWRGSKPDRIIEQFKKDFSPVTELRLEENYRSTRRLLSLADRFARTFRRRFTVLRPADSLPEGTDPVVYRANSIPEETEWIATQIGQDRVGAKRIGILVRNHAHAAAVSSALSRHRIEHATVDQFAFFRRQEIKDVLARLRLLLNPTDAGAMQRILLRPAPILDTMALDRFTIDGSAVGLRLSDLGRKATHDFGDPFLPLMRAYEQHQLVVLDVETTGLIATEHDVVEVAALRVGTSGAIETFHRYIRAAVRDSHEVHGLTDEFLKEHGEEADPVFRDLSQFMEGSFIVGHNVGFDLAMLRAHSARSGQALPELSYDDTLEISRRLFTLERYDLEHLCEHLQIAVAPTHRAIDDARATAELAGALVRLLEKGAMARNQLAGELRDGYSTVAAQLDTWRRLAEQTRPAALLREVLESSGLRSYYTHDERRESSLDEFVEFAEEADTDPSLPPLTALSGLVEAASLSNAFDRVSTRDARIPVITVHQAKGLEFDKVFVSGVTRGQFPSYKAKARGLIEEERRLFYVALTRPRQELCISCFDEDHRGVKQGPSRFLCDLGLVDSNAHSR